MIREIEIKKIFGMYDVKISLQNDNKIDVYIGENGIGKTSILNIINAVLTGDVNKVLGIDFEGIKVILEKKEFYFTKNDMLFSLNVSRAFRRIRMSLQHRLSREEFIEMLELSDSRKIQEVIAKLRLLIEERRVSPQLLTRFNEGLYENEEIDEEHLDIEKNSWLVYLNYLSSHPLRIMYFPTYRRIEEDILNMGVSFDNEKKIKSINYEESIEEVDSSVQMLKSGMKDVQAIIEDLQVKIKNASLESFNKVTGDMMTYLLKSDYEVEAVNEISKDTKKIEVILNRISDSNLKVEVKEEILNNLKNNTIEEKESLAFFIESLLKYYKQQEGLELQIKAFVNTCNKYLVNKQFIYDESKITISVINKINQKVIELDQLSSGEKQIISIFALIYLDQIEDKIFILIDEPELSLSLIWQEMLLEDIYNSEKVSYILAVTHSPFIYSNLPDESVKNMEAIFEHPEKEKL